jgi:hypothetical protein
VDFPKLVGNGQAGDYAPTKFGDLMRSELSPVFDSASESNPFSKMIGLLDAKEAPLKLVGSSQRGVPIPDRSRSLS